jgi:hypothetical protein
MEVKYNIQTMSFFLIFNIIEYMFVLQVYYANNHDKILQLFLSIYNVWIYVHSWQHIFSWNESKSMYTQSKYMMCWSSKNCFINSMICTFNSSMLSPWTIERGSDCKAWGHRLFHCNWESKLAWLNSWKVEPFL